MHLCIVISKIIRMSEIADYLRTIIPLRSIRGRSYVYISKNCPFSSYVSKKNNVFRYNSKLKVAKCYHCGKSFKELYWFKLILSNPNKVAILHIQNDKLIFNEEARKFHINKIKDKNHSAYHNFVKSEDPTLPF